MTRLTCHLIVVLLALVVPDAVCDYHYYLQPHEALSELSSRQLVLESNASSSIINGIVHSYKRYGKSREGIFRALNSLEWKGVLTPLCSLQVGYMLSSTVEPSGGGWAGQSKYSCISRNWNRSVVERWARNHENLGSNPGHGWLPMEVLAPHSH